MNRTYTLTILIILTNLIHAQKFDSYDKEISVNIGLAVPTMTSLNFMNSPESYFYKARFNNYTTLKRGYSIGLQFSHISNFKEVSVPICFLYRSKINRVTIPGTYGLTMPLNIILSAGTSMGVVDGRDYNELSIKLNRKFVGSLNFSARFRYLLGPISFFINPELSFLLTQNYSFNISTGWKNPISYLKGSFGLGYSF